MSAKLSNFRDYIPQALLSTPLAYTFLASWILLLLILLLDYLNYEKQRKRLGNVAVVGDAPYIWRRLRWTENEVNFRNILQRGYDNVGRTMVYRPEADKRQFSKKAKPWAYWGQHDDFIVVVPPATCEEVKNVDLDKLSFLHAVEDVSQPHGTHQFQ